MSSRSFSRKPTRFAVATAALAGMVLSVAPVTGVNQAFANEEVPPVADCSADEMYMLLNAVAVKLADGDGARTPARLGKIVKFGIEDGKFNYRSMEDVSNIFVDIARESDQGKELHIAPFDALGVSNDCTFYFIGNPNPNSKPASVDVWRLDAKDPNAEAEVIQRNMSMNSPTTGYVVSGAVDTEGRYYFGYFSRNDEADNSDADEEVVRFHLYSYFYEEGRDPDAESDPMNRSGEVAHIDIKVPDFAFANAKDNEFHLLHGDIAFNADGDLLIYSNLEDENSIGDSNEQLVAVVSAEQLAGVEPVWREYGAPGYKEPKVIEIDYLKREENNLVPIYTGVAFDKDQNLITIAHSEDANDSGDPFGKVSFNKVNWRTLETIDGGTNTISFEIFDQVFGPSDIPAGYEARTGRSILSADLASINFPSLSLRALVHTDERYHKDDLFEVGIKQGAESIIDPIVIDPNNLNDPKNLAAVVPIAEAGVEYTITQNIPANANYYTTTWV